MAWQSYDNMQAAGSVVSNVVDMSRWLRMHLGAGAAGEKRVLSETVVGELHAEQIEESGSFIFGDGAPVHYAMGWARTRFQGSDYISHGGGIFGFPAYAAMLPEAKAGVVVLTNGSLWTPYYPHQEIAAWVFARLLGVEPRDWHAESMQQTAAIHSMVDQALADLDAQRISGTSPSLGNAGYVGSYRGELSESLLVEEGADGLRLRFEGAGAFSGTLEHWHHDTFRLYYDGGDGQAFSSSLATFELQADGAVESLDLGRMGRYRRVD